MSHPVEKFFEELHADIEAGEFQKPSPEEDKALDVLFKFMKPYFDAALADAVARGILTKVEDK